MNTIKTIDQTVSGYPILELKEYKDRHDKIGKKIHWKIYHHESASHVGDCYISANSDEVEGEVHRMRDSAEAVSR